MRKRIIVWMLLCGFLASCQSIESVGVLVPPTVDQDPNLPSVSIRVAGVERKVHVRTFGNAANPVLFVLHGSYSDSRPYRNLCEGLSDKYFVVSWDQRGCGLSERITAEEFSLPNAVEEIQQMKNLYSPTRKIILLGQSWGGGPATQYTAEFPAQVEQLVLLEPIPLTGSDMQEVYATIIEFSYLNQSWNSLAQHSQALSPTSHEQLDYRAMMILRSTMTAGYHCDGRNPPAWNVHRVGGFVEYRRNLTLGDPIQGFTYNFTNGIQNFADSVLILGGSCSSLGFAVQSRYTKPHFRQARVVEIRNAGHRMNIEQYDAVMTALRGYLRGY
jgi:proline iminopeptidase